MHVVGGRTLLPRRRDSSITAHTAGIYDFVAVLTFPSLEAEFRSRNDVYKLGTIRVNHVPAIPLDEALALADNRGLWHRRGWASPLLQVHSRTLAHHGVLFVDELMEFRRDADVQ